MSSPVYDKYLEEYHSRNVHAVTTDTSISTLAETVSKPPACPFTKGLPNHQFLYPAPVQLFVYIGWLVFFPANLNFHDRAIV